MRHSITHPNVRQMPLNFWSEGIRNTREKKVPVWPVEELTRQVMDYLRQTLREWERLSRVLPQEMRKIQKRIDDALSDVTGQWVSVRKTVLNAAKEHIIMLLTERPNDYHLERARYSIERRIEIEKWYDRWVTYKTMRERATVIYARILELVAVWWEWSDYLSVKNHLWENTKSDNLRIFWEHSNYDMIINALEKDDFRHLPRKTELWIARKGNTKKSLAK